MHDEQHGGETVGDQQRARGVTERRFAGVTGFHQFQRSTVGVRLELIIEDGVLAVVDLAVFPHQALGNIFCADHVGGLLEEFVDRLTRPLEGLHLRRNGLHRGSRRWLGSRSLSIGGRAHEDDGDEGQRVKHWRASAKARKASRHRSRAEVPHLRKPPRR
ncbi:MAG: hypothetical protein DMG42_34010 [Acidobacteria bacterium]|nr:MAG: hypothetical protein DMG42_34010 [Acidobacteriota bacterium]